MKKYILYVIMAVSVAFALNYFNIVSIPWLDFTTEEDMFSEETVKKGHNSKTHTIVDDSF